MGNGASQSARQGAHSDSRVSMMRLDDVSEASRGHGSNTVTLRFSHQEFAPSDDNKKQRTRSLSGADDASPSAAAVAEVEAAYYNHNHNPHHQNPHHHGLHALDEGREDHNSSTASTPTAKSSSSNETAPRVEDQQENHADLSSGYEDESFEDDAIEWTRGEALGAGSYGTVYLARDDRTGALMAVKEIVVAEESEDDVHHASREVELLRSLRHPNIVKYLGSRVDSDARKLHIFTEWVPGGNLEQNRKRFGGSERVVRRFTRQILLGVAYLHAKRVIHQDIKPSNLLVDQFGVVKLADFGSSRLLSTSTLINNESMRGTPNYMAPEVIKQTGPRSVKADIWSVGCSVLRLLTGRPLWGTKHFDSQIALLFYIAHMEQLPPLPESLSPDARSFLTLCLAIDPARRPSAEELLQHPFVSGSGSLLSSPSRSTLGTLPPVKTAGGQSSALRINTAPPVETSPVSASASRRAVGSAPSSSMSPTVSKSQLVSTKFPARGLFDDATDDEAKPELSALSGRAKGTSPHHHSSRLLGTAAASILGLAAVTDTSDDDASDLYTFSEFAQTVGTTPRPVRGPAAVNSQSVAYTTWEDQPILTDAARAERERQLTRAAEEKRKKDDRDRQYQEELVEFRRLAVQHHAR